MKYKGMCHRCTFRRGKRQGYCTHYDNFCKAVAHNCLGPLLKYGIENQMATKEKP